MPLPAGPCQHYLNMDMGACLACSDLLRLAVSFTSIIQSARGISIRADILQGCDITECLIDSRNLTTIDSSGTLNVYSTLTLAITVSAGPVHLAIVIGIEVDDLEKIDGVSKARGGEGWPTNVHCAASIMLNDLVLGMVGAATNNPRLVSRRIIVLW